MSSGPICVDIYMCNHSEEALSKQRGAGDKCSCFAIHPLTCMYVYVNHPNLLNEFWIHFTHITALIEAVSRSVVLLVHVQHLC